MSVKNLTEENPDTIQKLGISIPIEFFDSKYDTDTLKKQWPDVTNIKGLGRCQIVEINGERVLQVTHAKGKLSATDGGASWRYRFEKPFDEFEVEYKVMLAPDFVYKRGGKLPGLCGGSNPRGGTDNISAKNY